MIINGKSCNKVGHECNEKRQQVNIQRVKKYGQPKLGRCLNKKLIRDQQNQKENYGK